MDSKKTYIAGPISGIKNYKENFEKAEKYLCDTVFMLLGWEKSVGAKIEHSLAVQADKKIIYENAQGGMACMTFLCG